MSSHKFPYGDVSKVKTLTEQEYKQLWNEVKEHNIDKNAPSTNGPKIFIYNEDNNKNKKEVNQQKNQKRKQIFPKHQAMTFKDINQSKQLPLNDEIDTESKESKSERLSPRNLEERDKKNKHILIVVSNSDSNDDDLKNMVIERQLKQKEEIQRWDSWVQEHYHNLIKVLQGQVKEKEKLDIERK